MNEKVYESGPIQVWLMNEREDGGISNVPKWCTYNNEDTYQYFKKIYNVYVIIDSENNKKIACLLSNFNSEFYFEDGEQADISQYNIPEEVLAPKVMSEEERIMIDPLYRFLKRREKGRQVP